MLGTWKIRDGDRAHAAGAFQFERLLVRVTPWRAILLGVGAAAYLIGLVVHLPAEAVVTGDRDVVGTVWKGEAAVEPAFAVGWAARPLSSLLGLAPVADLTVRGPDTALAGTGSWRAGGLVLDQVEGTTSLRLLGAVAPALPFLCDGEASVRTRGLALNGGRTGEGLLRSGPAICTAAALPPVVATARSDADGLTVVARDPAGVELFALRKPRGGEPTLTSASGL